MYHRQTPFDSPSCVKYLQYVLNFKLFIKDQCEIFQTSLKVRGVVTSSYEQKSQEIGLIKV